MAAAVVGARGGLLSETCQGDATTGYIYEDDREEGDPDEEDKGIGEDWCLRDDAPFCYDLISYIDGKRQYIFKEKVGSAWLIKE